MQTAMEWIRLASPIPRIPSASTRRAFRFFLANAGYATPPGRALCALSLVKAEQWAETEGLEFVTEPDFDADLSFADTWPERDREAFRKQEHDVISVRLVRMCPDHGTDCKHAETLASLCGIVDADSSYLRVIRAELASEVKGGA